MDQITFSEAEYQTKKRKTRREIFLERMDKLIPWKQLEKKVARYYPKGQNGRPPYPLSAMLRVHCMQLFYNLSDPAMEDALYEIESMRQFAGLKLDRLPDETTILNKDLNFYRPDRRFRYAHIEELFNGHIDWARIERHLPDMLRVAVSIKLGKITASTILRRLGTYSRKNKLYFAFRELGKVVRTGFLLNYIDDVELRQTIHAATNKNEQFNGFAKWSFFGGEGIIAANLRHEQQKVVKYNHLVANMLILHNVEALSRVLRDMAAEGIAITEDVLKALSPYRTRHINRFGDYTLNFRRPVGQQLFDLKLAELTPQGTAGDQVNPKHEPKNTG